MRGYIALPAFRTPGPLDFSGLNEGIDALGKSWEKNRLLEQQKAIGAALQGGGQPALPTENRLLSASPAQYGASSPSFTSPAAGSAAAAGRDYPTPSNGVYDFIKQQEGYTPAAAWDVRQYSSGYGTKAKPGEVIDQAEAERRLRAEVGPIDAWISQNIKVPLTPEQRTGLTSFAYNLGLDDLQKLAGDVNAGNWQRVAERMPTFNKALNERTGQLEVVDGLTNRRNREAALVYGGAPRAAASRQAVPSGLNYDAAARVAFGQGNLDTGLALTQAQQAREAEAYNRTRQQTADQRATETHQIEVETRRQALEQAAGTRLAGIAQTIAAQPDPAQKAALWQRFVQSSPRIATTLQRYGVDLNNPDAGAQFLIAEARGLTDPKPAEFKTFKSDEGIYRGGPGGLEVIREPGASPTANKDAVKLEQDLRKEFAALSKDYKSIQEGADRVRVGSKLNNAVGDLSLIFGYMKLLDPGSVVREGEFANAENAQGVPDRIRNTWNRIINGERLTPQMRQEFVSAADALANEQMQRQERLVRQFRGISQDAGLDPNRIIMDFGANTPAQQPSGGASGPVPRLGPNDKAAYDALPSGAPFIDPEGNERTKP